jgi:hypothetical protein
MCLNAADALRGKPERGARMSANAREVPTHYSAAAKWLHWCDAVAVITLLLTGSAMKRIVPEGDLRDSLYNFHEALGALTLILMVARLARSALFGVPAPDSTRRAIRRGVSNDEVPSPLRPADYLPQPRLYREIAPGQVVQDFIE